MRVLILGTDLNPIKEIVEKTDCQALLYDKKINLPFVQRNNIEFIISYRYRHIIDEDIIVHVGGKIINLHISLLPYNRGADPNLWSFLEDTPKGVTIHYIDSGIDTGDIIAQKEVHFNLKQETLKTSYDKLNSEIIILFNDYWPIIRNNTASRTKQKSLGTYHALADKGKFEHLIKDKGYDTLVADIAGKAFQSH